MEIKKLSFKKREVEIKETYIDAEGKERERKRSVLVPVSELEETGQERRAEQDGNDKNLLPDQ